jgi:hypothetical protein
MVAAVSAKIHTIQWTQAILPNSTLTVGLHANWSGLKSFAAPGTPLALILASTSVLPAERKSAVHAAINGIVGGERTLHGVPYSLTEEFVSVYRMHTLIPDTLRIHSASTQ